MVTKSKILGFTSMKNFSLLVVLLLAVSCGSIYVSEDYDKKADFTAYKTYQYDFDEENPLSQFDQKRFIKYTDSTLQTKGYTLSDSPELWVVVGAQEFEAQSRNTIGLGIGGTGGNVGVGVSGGIPIGGSELRQNIVVSLVDSTTNAIVWEATSESDLKTKSNPDQRDAHFKKLVTKIFKNYPPEQIQ